LKQVREGQPRAAETLAEPGTEVVRRHPGRQPLPQPDHVVWPRSARSEGIVELLVAGFSDLADVRCPAPQPIGPTPLVPVAFGRMTSTPYRSRAIFGVCPPREALVSTTYGPEDADPALSSLGLGREPSGRIRFRPTAGPWCWWRRRSRSRRASPSGRRRAGKSLRTTPGCWTTRCCRRSRPAIPRPCASRPERAWPRYPRPRKRRRLAHLAWAPDRGHILDGTHVGAHGRLNCGRSGKLGKASRRRLRERSGRSPARRRSGPAAGRRDSQAITSLVGKDASGLDAVLADGAGEVVHAMTYSAVRKVTTSAMRAGSFPFGIG
jgi:hypothetical protein